MLVRPAERFLSCKKFWHEHETRGVGNKEQLLECVFYNRVLCSCQDKILCSGGIQELARNYISIFNSQKIPTRFGYELLKIYNLY
jgi:hypothetical protein